MMGNFQHDMSADQWTHDELIANLERAVVGCDERRDFFYSVKPDGSKHAMWKRHTLAVGEALKLLGQD